MLVSLILPAHNEEKRLLPTLATYDQYFQKKLSDSYEILIIANGCTDQTVAVAQDYARSCTQVRIFNFPEPIGKGGAIMKGFCLASGQMILFADADCATSPRSLLDLTSQLTNADIVIGSRWMQHSQILHKQPIKRRILSRFFNMTVRILFHLPYRDTQCGAKAFRRAAAINLAQVVAENDWTFDLDLLLWAKFFGYRVREVPITWEDKAGSKLHFRAAAKNVAASLWRLRHRKMQMVWDKSKLRSFRKAQL